MYNDFDLMSGFSEEDIVEEGFFCNPEQTVADLLNCVRDAVDQKINTKQQACELIDKLSEDAVSFNELLTEMANAIRDAKAGRITKDDMLAVCAPASRELKENCVALGLCSSKFTSETEDITEDEIACLREFIIGCKTVVEERLMEVTNYPGADQAGKAATIAHAAEGVLSMLEYDDFDIATEAGVGTQIKKSNEVKTANQLYKQGKKLYSYGNKDKAIETIKKAQKLYETAINKAKKNTKGHGVKRELSGSVNGFRAKDTFSTTIYEPGVASVIAYLEDRIDSCRALLLQWQNKAGKSSFKETKAQLKAERKEAKAAYKTQRKQDRADRKAARKAARHGDMADEAYYEDLLEQYALEAELGIDFSYYDSEDEAYEALIIESEVEAMAIEDGFADEIC